MYEVDVRFGSKIDRTGEVKPQRSAYMSKKVIAAHVVGALAKVVAIYEVAVEANAFRSDSAHGRITDAPNLACINGVKVIENWPVWREVLVSAASSPPCHFPIEAEIAPDNEVGREARIDSAGERLGRVVEIIQVEIGSRRSVHATDSELGIHLLLGVKRT